jgi:hypothetical protein
MKTLLNERSDEEWTVVYDLDQLMIEDKLMEQSQNGNIVEGLLHYLTDFLQFVKE